MFRSLLGVQYHRIASISVGYKQIIKCFPWILKNSYGKKDILIKTYCDMLVHMLKEKAFTEIEYQVYSNLFFGVLHIRWYA